MFSEEKQQSELQLQIINKKDFITFITSNTMTLLIMSNYIIRHKDDYKALYRPYFGRLHLEAAKVEELLDAYNAKNNKKWFIFRKAIATTKLFSHVIYICLHIKNSIEIYNLLKIQKNFEKATEDVLKILYQTIVNNSLNITECCTNFGITKPTIEEKRNYIETLPAGTLESNRKKRETKDPEKTIVYLITKFLNFSEQIKQLEVYKKVEKCNYASCIPDIVSEEKLRWLENKFHNIQSLYDTHISDTNLEQIDKNLPKLRGHVTIIYHLLEVATGISHYYERHTLSTDNINNKNYTLPIDETKLLNILLDYSIAFSEHYLTIFHDLSKNMLKMYAEETNKEIPIPNYRGFHVRPSTLVSRIVNHYGSDVYIQFDNEKFDASKPLQIFRINEKINAIKRKKISEILDNLSIIKKNKIKADIDSYRKNLQKIFLHLLEEKVLILYESNFAFKDVNLSENESLFDFSNKAIARYMAMGRIDIANDLTVIFTGDKRVLEDIEILAANGYGEDNYGNNIILPKELSYLKR